MQTTAPGRRNDEVLRRVRDLLAEGATLDEVDSRVIRPSSRDDDERSARWLYAWHCAAENLRARRHDRARRVARA